MIPPTVAETIRFSALYAYVPGQGSGSTLTVSGTFYTYTTRDGTVYLLTPWGGSKHQYSGSNRVASITYPTGEKVTFNWETVPGICIIDPLTGECGIHRASGERLRSVTSTNGYNLAFTFQIEDPASYDDPAPGWASIATVQAQNMSVNPTSQSWPTVTFGGVSGLGTTFTVTDSLSRVTTYSYSSGQLASVQRPGASSPNETVTWSSGLVSSVTLNGVTDNYGFTTVGSTFTATVTDPNSKTRIVKTDTTTGLVSSDTDELGKTTSYTYYSGTGLLNTVTAPLGNYVTYTYDSRGNVTQTTSTPYGTGLSPISTHASYPASDPTNTWMCASGTPMVQCNKPATTTDARSQVTNYTWDSTSGLPLNVTPPIPSTGAAQPQTRFTYTSVYGQYLSGGSLVNFATPVTRLSTISQCQTQDFTTNPCAGTADEVKTSVAYSLTGVTNSNALPLQVSKGAGNGSLTATATTTWDLIGDPTLVDGPLSGSNDLTQTRYDADREIVGVIGPGSATAKNRATRLTYNADGQVTKTEAGTVASQSDPDWASFTSLAEVDTNYDTNARPTVQKLVNSTNVWALTQTTYDNMGRVDCSAVRMNSATYSSLPTSACTLGTTGSYGPDRITKMGYDWDSRPLTTTIAYGLADQAVDATLTYSYNGKVTSLKDGQNNTTNFAYDGFDRLSTTTYPDTMTEQLAYNADSSITSFTTRSGDAITFNYDNLNRRTTLGSHVLADRTFTYDLLNRPVSATFSTGGQGITNSYDALSRLTASATNVGGTSRTMSYGYDLAGNRTQLMWWDGFYVNYDRLVTGEISAVRENGASSGAGVLDSYTYSDLGEPTHDTRGNGTSISWSYDPVGRLTGVTNDLAGTSNDLTITNSLNPASQITSQSRSNDAYSWTQAANGSTSYTPNNLNQYSAVGGTSYSYDNNGNLHSDGTNTWNFDALNRLTSSSTTAPGGVSTTETYDPLDRLDTYNPGSLQRFIYDGGEVVARLDSSGNITGRFVRGDGPDELLASYPDAGTTNRRWVGLDERNSVIALSDGSGNLTNINRYSEYGVPQSTNSTMDQYTGQLWIAGAGLQYSKARVYSPSLGRFLQMDPAGYAGGANLYAYVLNDPVNATDPTGLLRTLRYCFNPGGPAGEGPGGSIDIVGRVCVNVTVWDPEDFDSLFSRNQFVNLIEGALINPPSKPTCEHLLHVANGLENAGGKIQDFGASASAAGFTGDLIALAFPPAEIGTGSLTAAGGLITLAGTAVSGAGSTLNFFATHDLGRAALSVVGVLAGRLKASNDAHKFLRGLNIGKAVDLNKALSPSRCQ